MMFSSVSLWINIPEVHIQHKKSVLRALILSVRRSIVTEHPGVKLQWWEKASDRHNQIQIIIIIVLLFLVNKKRRKRKKKDKQTVLVLFDKGDIILLKHPVLGRTVYIQKGACALRVTEYMRIQYIANMCAVQKKPFSSHSEGKKAPSFVQLVPKKTAELVQNPTFNNTDVPDAASRSLLAAN